jgi:hypothetical protein
MATLVLMGVVFVSGVSLGVVTTGTVVGIGIGAFFTLSEFENFASTSFSVQLLALDRCDAPIDKKPNEAKNPFQKRSCPPASSPRLRSSISFFLLEEEDKV